MNTKILVLLVALLATVCLSGCRSVDITKTGKGFHAPTNPNDVEILMTRPDRAYDELGTINATGFPASETAKMHNALRAKAAPLGANAVIVTGSGMLPGGLAGPKQWITGVAIGWK
jgi:hypothetical protein